MGVETGPSLRSMGRQIRPMICFICGKSYNQTTLIQLTARQKGIGRHPTGEQDNQIKEGCPGDCGPIDEIINSPFVCYAARVCYLLYAMRVRQISLLFVGLVCHLPSHLPVLFTL